MATATRRSSAAAFRRVPRVHANCASKCSNRSHPCKAIRSRINIHEISNSKDSLPRTCQPSCELRRTRLKSIVADSGGSYRNRVEWEFATCRCTFGGNFQYGYHRQGILCGHRVRRSLEHCIPNRLVVGKIVSQDRGNRCGTYFVLYTEKCPVVRVMPPTRTTWSLATLQCFLLCVQTIFHEATRSAMHRESRSLRKH